MAEYAAILAFIVAVLIVTYQIFGAWVAGLFNQFVTTFT